MHGPVDLSRYGVVASEEPGYLFRNGRGGFQSRRGASVEMAALLFQQALVDGVLNEAMTKRGRWVETAGAVPIRGWPSRARALRVTDRR